MSGMILASGVGLQPMPEPPFSTAETVGLSFASAFAGVGATAGLGGAVFILLMWAVSLSVRRIRSRAGRVTATVSALMAGILLMTGAFLTSIPATLRFYDGWGGADISAWSQKTERVMRGNVRRVEARYGVTLLPATVRQTTPADGWDGSTPSGGRTWTYPVEYVRHGGDVGYGNLVVSARTATLNDTDGKEIG